MATAIAMINARKNNDPWRFLGLEKEDLLHQAQRFVVSPSPLIMAILIVIL
jgi:hypothetical protein